MTKSTNMTWLQPVELPDEHRIFRLSAKTTLDDLPAQVKLHRRGLWAIADNSGNYPQDTDDGLLWLDFNRDLMAGSPARDDRPGNSPGIPLLDSQAKEQRAVCDTTTLLTLSIMFTWNINCLGMTTRAIAI
jgi:hypothetical protein